MRSLVRLCKSGLGRKSARYAELKLSTSRDASGALADGRGAEGGEIMRYDSAIKRPPSIWGSTLVHRRPTFGQESVSEQGYFNMLQHVKAKPEVRS